MPQYLAHVRRGGDLRFERQVNAVLPQLVQYDDRWTENDYKQMAMLVDRQGETYHFHYTLDWYDVAISTFPTIPENTQLRLGEMQVGDSCVIGLRRYAGNHPGTGNPPTVLRALTLHPLLLTTVAPVYTLTQLDNATQTCCYSETSTGILWIKLFAGAPGTTTPAIAVDLSDIADGLGQAVFIDY